MEKSPVVIVNGCINVASFDVSEVIEIVISLFTKAYVLC